MKLAAMIAAIMVMAGCSITEKQREARQYRDAEWRAEFLEYRAKCKTDGGRLVVHGDTQRHRRYGIPDYGDFYACQARGLSFR
jgi:hypothetical protein